MLLPGVVFMQHKMRALVHADGREKGNVGHHYVKVGIANVRRLNSKSVFKAERIGVAGGQPRGMARRIHQVDASVLETLYPAAINSRHLADSNSAIDGEYGQDAVIRDGHRFGKELSFIKHSWLGDGQMREK